MKTFQTSYKGHQIRVENRWLGERLLVDNEVQDERTGFALRSRLWGSIRNGSGAAEWIKVELGGWMTTDCWIFVGDRLVYPGGFFANDAKNR